jgi:hypothetical protein
MVGAPVTYARAEEERHAPNPDAREKEEDIYSRAFTRACNVPVRPDLNFKV